MEYCWNRPADKARVLAALVALSGAEDHLGLKTRVPAGYYEYDMQPGCSLLCAIGRGSMDWKSKCRLLDALKPLGAVFFQKHCNKMKKGKTGSAAVHSPNSKFAKKLESMRAQFALSTFLASSSSQKAWTGT
jgi:hypothetical protein